MTACMRRGSWVTAIAVLLGLWLAPGFAKALPGDPPIVPLGPANGAIVPADEFGIKVSFQCPAYHSEEDEEEEEEEEGGAGSEVKPTPEDEDLADASDYTVRFSTSPATESDGRLSTAGFGEEYGEGFPDPGSDKVTCATDLELPANFAPVALYQGTIYWQAARQCDACASEWEAGPVRSFNLVPNVEEPELDLQEHVYAGYLTDIGFSSFSDLTGATIELQRFEHGAWAPLAQEPAQSSDEAAFFVKLPAAHTALRTVLKTATISLPLAPQKVTIHKLGKRRSTSAHDDGRYLAAPKKERATMPVSLMITDRGKELRGLRAAVEATCPGPTPAQDAKLKVAATLRSARIAPDGTVVGQMLTKGPQPAYVTLVGQLFDHRLSGTLTTSFAGCSGTREIEAVKVTKRPGKTRN